MPPPTTICRSCFRRGAHYALRFSGMECANEATILRCNLLGSVTTGGGDWRILSRSLPPTPPTPHPTTHPKTPVPTKHILASNQQVPLCIRCVAPSREPCSYERGGEASVAVVSGVVLASV